MFGPRIIFRKSQKKPECGGKRQQCRQAREGERHQIRGATRWGGGCLISGDWG